MLKNSRFLSDKQRALRAGMTDAERKIWSFLRNRQFHGHRFLRQYGAGSYILDFFCPQLKLAVEVDGSQHLTEEGKQYDEKRTAYLIQNNIRVIRFLNNEVLTNADGVHRRLSDVLERTPLILPFWTKGRGRQSLQE